MNEFKTNIIPGKSAFNIKLFISFIAFRPTLKIFFFPLPDPVSLVWVGRKVIFF